MTQELPSGKDKAMQTEMFEVDPLSDNRKLYVRAAEALLRERWWESPRRPCMAWERMP